MEAILIADSGWYDDPDSRPMRGLHKFMRKVDFKIGTPQADMERYINTILEGVPRIQMWKYEEQSPLMQYLWFVYYGYDSGD